jgi:hypothetical protein
MLSFRDVSCMHKTTLTFEVGICSSGPWFCVTGHSGHYILNHFVSAVLWMRYLPILRMMLLLWVWFLTFRVQYFFLNCQKPNTHHAVSLLKRLDTSSTPLQKLKNSYSWCDVTVKEVTLTCEFWHDFKLTPRKRVIKKE